MLSLKWLIPGMQVKRWLALLLCGTTLIALALASGLIEIYQTIELDPASNAQTLVGTLTGQFLHPALRAGLLALSGLALIGGGLYGLSTSLLDAERSTQSGRLLDKVDRRRRKRSEYKIVAIGGGTGLSTMLRGLKEHSSNITAIVTVADDGGSSGRLRSSLGVHPPGDFRQCIAALADTEPLMERLFQYRFGEGELGGHSFGNLFIVAMAGITGSFESALRASSRVLRVSGRIMPSTLDHVTLFAELADDKVMKGESKVPKGNAPIRRVYLEPANAAAYPEAVAAILDADLVVIGPGSLYTSVLPNLLVPNIAKAIEATRAPVLYVANVATQPGETDDYDLEAHVEAIQSHMGRSFPIDFVVANDNTSLSLPANASVTRVLPRESGSGSAQAGKSGKPHYIHTDLVNPAITSHHHPDLLAEAVVSVLRDDRKAE